MCLFGPSMFTYVNIEVRTNHTVNCFIQQGLMPFRLTVQLTVMLIIQWQLTALQNILVGYRDIMNSY